MSPETQHQTENTQLGLSSTSANQANREPSSKIVDREPIHGTPFHIITKDAGSFVSIGQYRLTEYQSKNDCLEMIESKNWLLLCNLMGVIAESHIHDR